MFNNVMSRQRDNKQRSSCCQCFPPLHVVAVDIAIVVNAVVVAANGTVALAFVATLVFVIFVVIVSKQLFSSFSLFSLVNVNAVFNG